MASEIQHAPANLTPILPRWTQRDALVPRSPVGVDRLAETTPGATTPMLSAVLGSLFPFVSGSIVEDGTVFDDADSPGD